MKRALVAPDMSPVYTGPPCVYRDEKSPSKAGDAQPQHSSNMALNEKSPTSAQPQHSHNMALNAREKRHIVTYRYVLLMAAATWRSTPAKRVSWQPSTRTASPPR